MKRHLLRFWLQRFRQRPNSHISGFTLIELLVVTIVGSLIMLALLTLINQLLLADRNESVRLETNREMQLAMDYMAEELREASYIYTGHCLMERDAGAGEADALRCDDVDSRAIGDPNSGILPASIINTDDTIPVLAFWKQHPIPDQLKDDCAADPTIEVDGEPVPCTTGSSYALVVYALSIDDPNDNTWRGGAQIRRYMLTEFNGDGTARTPGYANPTQNSNNFVEWPYADGVSVDAGANAPVLVDFVDGTPADESTLDDENLTYVEPTCPDGYSISPHPDALAAAGDIDDDLRSFYACVSQPGEGRYQEAILFLRGNIEGRVGGLLPRQGSLTTLQTRVKAGGVFEAD